MKLLDRRLLAIVLTVAALGSIGAVARYKLGPRHFLVVEESVLYRSGALRARNLRDVVEDHGIRTVVNLRLEASGTDWYRSQRDVCEDLGVRHVDIPMAGGVPPTEEQIETWLGLLGDPAAQPILVHCEQGVIRTGMMVAIYEVERRGRPNEEVLATLPRFGHDLGKPKNERMRRFILEYRPRGTSP